MAEGEFASGLVELDNGADGGAPDEMIADPPVGDSFRCDGDAAAGSVGFRGQRVCPPLPDTVDIDPDSHVLPWGVAAPAAAGLPAVTVARFAELVIAFIDELSASSVTGHADELVTTGRVKERYLERLGQHLVAGESVDVLQGTAEKAGWAPPKSLTAVLLPAAQVRGLVSGFGPSTLQLSEDLPGIDPAESLALPLLPICSCTLRPCATG